MNYKNLHWLIDELYETDELWGKQVIREINVLIDFIKVYAY